MKVQIIHPFITVSFADCANAFKLHELHNIDFKWISLSFVNCKIFYASEFAMKNGFSNQNFGYEYFHGMKLFRCIPRVDRICSYE